MHFIDSGKRALQRLPYGLTRWVLITVAWPVRIRPAFKAVPVRERNVHCCGPQLFTARRWSGWPRASIPLSV